MKLSLSLFCLLLIHIARSQPAKIFSIITYGAVQGNVFSTNAIQQAIDAAATNEGGRVIIPVGRYLTGAIYLRSGVELHLEKGAVLLGSADWNDYLLDGKPGALLRAVQEKKIAVTGEGIIDGQGEKLILDIFQKLRTGLLKDASWIERNGQVIRRPGEVNRPKLIEFLKCDSIRIADITLQHGTSWIQEYRDCRNILIDGIKVESTTYWNNDGLDLTDCINARVVNCIINSSDDAICLKSEDRNSRCENIYIADCRLRSSANAVKFGTASRGGFKNITVRNIEVYDTYRSAIALEAVDGGVLENIEVSDIRARNTGNAFLIRSAHRNKDSVYSKIRGIHISNMLVEVPAGKPDKGYPTEGPLLKYPPGIKKQGSKINSVSPWNHSWADSTAVIYEHNVFPSSVAGLPGHPVEDVVLENIEIRYAGGGDSTVNYFPIDSALHLTEAVADYPEFSMFGELPVWGLYVRHTWGIKLKNIRLVQQKPDYRAGVLLLQSEAIDISKMDLSGPLQANPVVLIKTGHRQLTHIRLNKKSIEPGEQYTP